MLVEYNTDGRITHVIYDPVPKEMEKYMTEQNKTFLVLPPEPWPAEPQWDPETGEPILEYVFDEEGNQVFEEVEDEEGLKVKVPKLQQQYMSNGVTTADVDITRDHVVDGKVVERPQNPAIVELSGRVIQLSGVLEGSAIQVIMDGISIDVDPTETELELDEPGLVKIRITSPWPYLEAVHDVEVK